MGPDGQGHVPVQLGSLLPASGIIAVCTPGPTRCVQELPLCGIAVFWMPAGEGLFI